MLVGNPFAKRAGVLGEGGIGIGFGISVTLALERLRVDLWYPRWMLDGELGEGVTGVYECVDCGRVPVELDRVSSAVDVVLIAYGWSLDVTRSRLGGGAGCGELAALVVVAMSAQVNR